MKTRSVLTLMGLVLASLLSGCALSDVGEVASRKSVLPGAQRTPSGILAQTEKTLRELRPESGGACKIENPDSDPGDRYTEFANLNGLARQTPAASQSSRLKANDMVSLRLRSAFISDNGYTPENFFSDLGTSAEALGETTTYLSKGITGSGFQINLEVLVAANAFDYNGGGFGYKPEDRRNAKVIFFSDDVEEGQFLNIDNLPIIGPVKYTGTGFGLQLYVLEIDAEDKQQKALLSSLAGLGTAAAGATGPASSILNTLTTALLDNGNGDDRIFEYSVGFDTGYVGANVDYVPFEENLYALVVDHARQRGVPWERMALNSETAELYLCKPHPTATAADAGRWEIYRESTYLIVQVLKGYQGQGVAQLTQQSVAQLTDALSTAVETKVDDAINAYTETLKSDVLFEQARSLLGKIREGAARVPDAPPAKTPTHAANDPQVRLAALSLAEIMTSANPIATPVPPLAGKVLLKRADFSYLLAELYDIAVQANGSTVPDVTKFDPASVGTDKTAFYTKLKGVLLP